jgi:predicted RNA binding protein YcfA (HicA-like mRNA interferase family)
MAGFYIDHQSGSHARLFHSVRPELRVTIPIHSKDLPSGTLKSILRQADLSVEDFLELLK